MPLPEMRTSSPLCMPRLSVCVTILPVQRRHLDGPAQGRLADRDRHLTVQILALAHEQRMLADAENAVQIARRRPRLAGLALAGQPNAHVVVHAGRNVHRQRAFDLDGTASVAGAAGIGDDHALTAAGTARLLNAEEALALNDDAMSAAPPAGRGRVPGLAPLPPQSEHVSVARDFDLLLHAARRFQQVDFERHLQVAAGLRTAPPPPTTEDRRRTGRRKCP